MPDIINIRSGKEIKRFINLPHKIYSGDLNYVPFPYAFAKRSFNKGKNPFFEHSEASFFMAMKHGEEVGRIAAIRNNVHLATWKDGCGFFGFFDTINDFEVAKALLDRACKWLQDQGLNGIIGPVSYTTNELCGLLSKGFEKPPYVLMPYNKEYYNTLLENYGFSPSVGLKSYSFTSDSFRKIAGNKSSRLEKRLNDQGVRIRTINFREFDQDIKLLREAYNEAFQNNWGFVPLSPAEFDDYARTLKEVTKPEMVLIAEHDKRIVGFLCAIYNINQLFIHIRKGKIFPSGLFNYLKYRNTINQARILIMGVIEEYRNRGIDLCLYNRIFDVLVKNNIHDAEAAYVMDNNQVMSGIIEKVGGSPDKEYQLYKLDF